MITSCLIGHGIQHIKKCASNAPTDLKQTKLLPKVSSSAAKLPSPTTQSVFANDLISEPPPRVQCPSNVSITDDNSTNQKNLQVFWQDPPYFRRSGRIKCESRRYCAS